MRRNAMKRTRLIQIQPGPQRSLFGVCRGYDRFCFISAARSDAISGHVAVCHDVSGQSAELSTATHNWGARRTPSKLEVLARAAGGVVEAISVKGRPIAGIM